MIDDNLYFYRTITPSTTEGVIALQRWKEDLLLDLPNQHVALKLESMHNFIQFHFYNRKIIKNVKRVINHPVRTMVFEEPLTSSNGVKSFFILQRYELFLDKKNP